MQTKKRLPLVGPPRAIAPAGLADFDEQRWPVNLLLFLFAACVGAVIIVKSDFASPRLLANGWFHLGALVVIVAVLAWGVVRFEGRVQHRMQLGVFLSLLVHLWLCMLSYNIYLSAIAQREKDAAEAFDEPAPVTLPDYNWQDQALGDATDPTLDTPLETVLPETEQEIERTPLREQPQQRPAEKEPEVRPVQPTMPDIERMEISAPRRADELAGRQISRQDRRLAETNEQATIPKLDEDQQRRVESAARAERTETQLEHHRALPQDSLPTNGPAVASPVRQPRREEAPAATAMVLPRQSVAAAVNAPARPAIERLAESARAASRLTAADSALQRVDTAAPMARRSQSVRESPAATIETLARRNERLNSSQPRVDSRAQAPLAKSLAPSETAVTAIATADAHSAVERNLITETPLEAVGRARASLPNASAPATGDSEVIAASATASTSPARIEAVGQRSSDEPSVSSATNGAPVRRVSTANGETTAMESPAASLATVSDQPAAQPAASALTKASGGAAGLTRQRHFDSEQPGITASVVARSAARRPEAAQELEEGSATAPSTTARLAKARAGAELPTAALRADDSLLADAAGAARPADTEASASAAVERMASAAPRGRFTAAAGTGAIDQGAPQVSSTIGEGRTSGGGEPSLTSSETQARIAKASGGAAAGGPDSHVVAELPAEIGGSPSEPAPSIAGIGRTSTADGLPSGGRSVLADSTEGPARAALVAEVEGHRKETSPDIATQGAATTAARPRAGGPIEGRVEPAAVAEIAAGEPAGTTTLGNNEPASASDVVRQSPAGLPGGGAMAAVDVGGFAAGAPAARQASPRRSSDEPSFEAGNEGGSRRTKATGTAALIDVAVADDAGGAPGSESTREELTAATDTAGERRAAALPVLVAASPGAGGLSAEHAFDVGVPNRRARPESEVAHVHSGRLILERSGANRAAEVRVQDVAVPGYRQRDRQLREDLARQRGGSEGSERAVEMGLDFLARHQNVDGSWSLDRFSQGRAGYENAGHGQMVSDTAGTGLALLAFLGAGYTHTDGKYRLVVGRGLNYLLGNQQADGDLFLPQEAKSNLNVWLYSHGIASIALCEAYGMTRDPGLKPPAQHALDFIVAAQHPTDGGWRYAPRQGSDTSVSGWQLMALKSGELAGLEVPPATYAKVSRWLDSAQAPGHRAQYVYRPKARQQHQRVASRVMTAEALLMRQYLGWKRDHALMAGGADLLVKELPEWSVASGWQRDSYYWYYATQVMFQMGGQHWDAWNERLRPLLVEKQVADGPLSGSWEPLGDVPDRWGKEGGRIYVTAMHLLMLEVYYRHLPLYRSLDEP